MCSLWIFKYFMYVSPVSLATIFPDFFLLLEMSGEDTNIPPWKCGICKLFCVHPESLLDQHFCAIRTCILTDEGDQSKWIVCHTCGTWYHWICVVSVSQNDKELKLPFQCSPMCVPNAKSNWDNPSETLKVDLPKWENHTVKRDFSYFDRMPRKIKFSEKGMHKKIHRVEAQSHKGTKNQQYDPKMWEKAQRLRELNKTLEKGQKKWTLDAIFHEAGIPKSTLGHRFNSEKTGTRKGMGHIAGGKQKGRVLPESKQARKP